MNFKRKKVCITGNGGVQENGDKEAFLVDSNPNPRPDNPTNPGVDLANPDGGSRTLVTNALEIEITRQRDVVKEVNEEGEATEVDEDDNGGKKKRKRNRNHVVNSSTVLALGAAAGTVALLSVLLTVNHS